MEVISTKQERNLIYCGYTKHDHGWIRKLDDSMFDRFHWIDGKIHIDAKRRDNKNHYVANNKRALLLLTSERDRIKSVLLQLHPKKSKEKKDKRRARTCYPSKSLYAYLKEENSKSKLRKMLEKIGFFFKKPVGDNSIAK